MCLKACFFLILVFFLLFLLVSQVLITKQLKLLTVEAKVWPRMTSAAVTTQPFPIFHRSWGFLARNLWSWKSWKVQTSLFCSITWSSLQRSLRSSKCNWFMLWNWQLSAFLLIIPFLSSPCLLLSPHFFPGLYLFLFQAVCSLFFFSQAYFSYLLTSTG